MAQVITFGDALFRFSTAKGERLATTTSVDFHLGGTELNVAVNLHTLGVDAEWVSCLPDGLMGELIHARLQQHGIKFPHCQTIRGGQAGWYLLESGGAPRPDLVFERRSSSMAQLTSFAFDWRSILRGASIFHTSGVAAGMSPAVTQEIARAMQAARDLGVKVSYDFNYRRNLWSLEEFVARQQALLPLIDILFCSNADLELFFKQKFMTEDYQTVFEKTRIETIVMGHRSDDESSYGTNVYHRSGKHHSRRHSIMNIDRIGVGDSMTAGYLWGLVNGDDPKQCAEKAAAAGAFKYTIKGDMALLRPGELTTYLEQGYKAVIR